MTPSQFRNLDAADRAEMMAHDVAYATMQAVEREEQEREMKKQQPGKGGRK